MSSLRWLISSILVMLCVAIVPGCDACSSDVIAELSKKDGYVVRDRESTLGQWVPAALGAEFRLGDAVQTTENASGEVTFDDTIRLQLEPSTIVRFRRSADHQKPGGISVEAGQAVIEAGAQTVRLETDFGLAILQPGTVASLHRAQNGLRVQVRVGLARLEGTQGAIDLAAGHGVEVAIGMAVLERFDPEPPPAEVPVTPVEPQPAVEQSGVLTRVEGTGATVREPGKSRFTPLASGEHQLSGGSTLRLTDHDGATVTSGSASVSLGPGSYVIGSDEATLLTLASGAANTIAQGANVAVAVPGGTITYFGESGASAGEVRLKKAGELMVSARTGELELTIGDSRTRLHAGDYATIVGGRVVRDRAPGFYDITASAGASLLIHDPEPPVAVRFLFPGKCPQRGIVERLAGAEAVATAIGTASANLRFGPGARPYQLRCLSEQGAPGPVLAKGLVTVFRDGGTAALARKAPLTEVNTDGRDYTILYQNLLPSVTVRWPNAPPATSYTLKLTSGSAERSVTADAASVTFPSGVLGEGTHSFAFQSATGRTSRPARAIIQFDNAAPKAIIKAPSNGAFGPGETIDVAGIALPGWGVSAEGVELALDPQQRFAGSVTANPRGLVLVFSHPERGSHYYLRRAQGAER